MARYDVYRHPDGSGLLLDLQSDLLGVLGTRVVAPLVPKDLAPPPAARLNPVFNVAGVPHVLLTQALAAIPAGLLKAPLTNLGEASDAVTGAIDMVFHGF